MPEESRTVVSSDGILHTGDMGRVSCGVLCYVCRSRHVVKPKGYQVYPPEVEDILLRNLNNRASAIAVVGAPHETFTEGIMAFVEAAQGCTDLSPEEVLSVASKSIDKFSFLSYQKFFPQH
jgi:Acyl-CoA synthetases (AMP-forming)/AMP-acid ligases II